MVEQIALLVAETCPEANAAALIQRHGPQVVRDAIETLARVEPGPVSGGRLASACADGWCANRNPSTWALEQAGIVREQTRAELARRFPFAHIKANIDAVDQRFKGLKSKDPERFALKVYNAVKDNDAKWSAEAEARRVVAQAEQAKRVQATQAQRAADAAAILQEQANANADRAAARAEFAQVDAAVLKLALDEVIAALPLIARGSHNTTRIKSGDVEAAASHFLRRQVRERIALILSGQPRHTQPESAA